MSTLDVASSRISTRGSNASARANDSSCFCPTDKRRAALGDRRAVPVRQLRDERVRVHGLRRPAHLLVAERRVAQTDVVGDRPREQMDVLQHEADEAPQIRKVELANVHAVHGDAPAVDVVEPSSRLMIVDLPAPVAPTMPTRWPGPDLEAHVAQDVVGVVSVGRPAPVVRKPHAFEDDVPGGGRAAAGRARPATGRSPVRRAA